MVLQVTEMYFLYWNESYSFLLKYSQTFTFQSRSSSQPTYISKKLFLSKIIYFEISEV